MKVRCDDGTFFFTHELIDMGGEGLVNVCLHEIEGAMSKDEITFCANYMERWVV